jgi:uncharacterized protein (TIGR00255 family)
MLLSMTGYGAAQTTHDGVAYSVEVRSVNHRYLKIGIKLPESLQFAEPELEAHLRKRVGRGAVNLSVRARGQAAGGLRPLDMNVVQAYVDQLTQARLPGFVQPTIDLAAIALLPGATEATDLNEAARAQVMAALSKTVDEAIDALIEMRRDEGRALLEDLTGAVQQIRAEVASIAARAPRVVEEYFERLRSRVAALTKAAELEVQADALLRELAVFAERCDISEEINRLQSHLDQFVELCRRGDQVGRTLDFLAQELLREANTIGSKSNDVAIARSVVQVKGLVDRLKEQVQNVE